MLNLDTHILLFAMQGSLTSDEKKLLSTENWGVSAIVLWEIAKLFQHGRISIDVGSPEFARSMAGIHVWPLDVEVCRWSTKLDFSSDPADELVAATSIVHGVPLVTRDAKILRSKLVPFAKVGTDLNELLRDRNENAATLAWFHRISLSPEPVVEPMDAS